MVDIPMFSRRGLIHAAEMKGAGNTGEGGPLGRRRDVEQTGADGGT